MIRFHPDNEQLASYVRAELPPAESLIVAAHTDLCPECRDKVQQFEDAIAIDEIDATSIEASDDVACQFDQMLSQILLQPEHKNERRAIGNEQLTGVVELDGRRFCVPRSLMRYTKKTGNWSSLVGKLWQAPVDLGNQGVANFIYMGCGGSVPEHTHRGTEYTLVLDGEFSDGLNYYRTGDFIALNGTHTHAPKSDVKEGCFVFSIVDQPLHFTSGIARLLNPFSHLFFR